LVQKLIAGLRKLKLVDPPRACVRSGDLFPRRHCVPRRLLRRLLSRRHHLCQFGRGRRFDTGRRRQREVSPLGRLRCHDAPLVAAPPRPLPDFVTLRRQRLLQHLHLKLQQLNALNRQLMDLHQPRDIVPVEAAAVFPRFRLHRLLRIARLFRHGLERTQHGARTHT